jgi:hypothetical protein
VQTGVLEGASIPRLTQPLAAQDSASNVLRLAVIGSILQHYAPLLLEVDEALKAKTEKSPFTSMSDDLNGAFPNAQGQKAQEQKAEKQKAKDQYAGPYRYESRVLEGIWAAAPYLHNGSVPTLAELLKPAAERVAAFQIGPSYDVVNVGLATTQTKFGYTLTTTDCAKRDSGNSRCGHEFGTQLTDPEKKALLEYLKTL